ncbi:MAG: FtsX-like permease family protein [Candidatus Thiodiazotropha weberae]|nr:FtsX-like permease family protein [Candidatus Thiodiazotropha lotti]ODC01907.1 ABC transporter permease [Candidatus Thiodiazotropha endoloripes]MCG7931880.1 FtsX-like permease family protein [Candidatus Thiodiazotropha lotti]MCG7989040.1 FtsX-like permease family protein [Candidatus Thiodiazotropha lotti]MCG8019557.1 FtsX-like permease family protein [Candidatus Thiodiazotropha lotti]
MNPFMLALKLLRRDWRAGELRLLATALVIAVASVTAVGFFTDRIERAMARQATEVLAADLRIESNRRLDEALSNEAEQRQMRQARTLTFPSVVLNNGNSQLVQVKSVSANYPLRGKLQVRDQVNGTTRYADDLPGSGEAWLEERLLPLLGLQIGDRFKLGQLEFTLSRIITYEPDRSANLFQLAPRVMINQQDVQQTGLLGPASRVRHNLLIAGTPAQISDYRAWLDAQQISGIQVQDIRAARPELRAALDQGGRFLRLAAATAILLCVVAVALSSRRFVERQADTSALLRCLGAKRNQVLQIFVIRLLGLGVIASLLGSLLGLAAQTLLVELVGHWFTQQIPPPSPWPLLSGVATGILVLLGFSLPMVTRLAEVPPLRVFRRHLGAPPIGYLLFISAGVAALATLLIWQIGDDQMAFKLIGGLLGGLLLLLLIARLLVTLLTPLRTRTAGSWRYGLASLSRNPITTSVQLSGFGLGMTVLLVLALVRVDLLSNWREALPADSPNQFLINIQPDQVDGVRNHLQQSGIPSVGLYPMMRGRLISIDGKAVSAGDYPNPRAQRLATRDFNLSQATSMQTDNKIVAGRWWSQADWGEPWFSVEEGIAKTLGIPMGALLTFEVAGQQVSGKVTNLRSVKWDSFNVNFFVVGTPGLMQDLPATYITSFYLPDEQRTVLHKLIHNYPSITALDVTALMKQVRGIMDRGAMAVESVFLFTLAAGLIVLYAGIQASHEQRVQETAILRTLGLSRQQLILSITLEFALLGGLAGVISAGLASGIGYSLSTGVFNLPWQFNPQLWLVAVFGGAIGIGAAGTLASWSLFNTPPILVLRRA